MERLEFEEWQIDFVKQNINYMSLKEIQDHINLSKSALKILCKRYNFKKGHIKHLEGQKFGQLTVIEMADKKTESGSIIWKCVTDSGIECEIPAYAFSNLSSHWFHDQLPADQHGLSHTRLYTVWRHMRQKCSNPKASDYEIYGGRGIRVCDEWQHFMSFYNWAMQNGYDENAPRGQCTIDRIDVDGNYEPNNCRIVNMHVQANNRRNYGRFPYYGLHECEGRYRIGISINGKRISLGSSPNKEDIPYLLQLRNDYIDEHHLLNKKNTYDPNIIIPELLHKKGKEKCKMK